MVGHRLGKYNSDIDIEFEENDEVPFL